MKHETQPGWASIGKSTTETVRENLLGSPPGVQVNELKVVLLMHLPEAQPGSDLASGRKAVVGARCWDRGWRDNRIENKNNQKHPQLCGFKRCWDFGQNSRFSLWPTCCPKFDSMVKSCCAYILHVAKISGHASWLSGPTSPKLRFAASLT